MMSTNPNVGEFILMDEGAVEVRPKATDFGRRFGPNTRKGEPDQFSAFLGELELEMWDKALDLQALQRTSIKYNNINPKEYLFQPELNQEGSAVEHVEASSADNPFKPENILYDAVLLLDCLILRTNLRNIILTESRSRLV